MKKTKFFNQENRNWVLIDAKDKILGRLATRIAKILQGKNKATYTPNFLCGDSVVVINAKHIRLTANKYEKKVYTKYSGYPSGQRHKPFSALMEKSPTRALHMAVRGMLPRNDLSKKMLRALKIYPEAEHKHQAQEPKLINV
jgi:large subunit ribosomal protein L13